MFIAFFLQELCQVFEPAFDLVLEVGLADSTEPGAGDFRRRFSLLAPRLGFPLLALGWPDAVFFPDLGRGAILDAGLAAFNACLGPFNAFLKYFFCKNYAIIITSGG